MVGEAAALHVQDERCGADAPAIEEAYRTAIESAHRQGARFFELRAAIPYARWLKSQGRIVEARKLLAEVYAWFTEGLDTVVLKEAKALLDELNNQPGPAAKSERARKRSIGAKPH